METKSYFDVSQNIVKLIFNHIKKDDKNTSLI